MIIKKAMILGAGLGKRMLPLTTKIPKPLIKIGPKNLLERTIDLLIKIGIEEIIINTHYLSDVIENFIKNKKYKIHISIVKEEMLLDTGGGILNATKKFESDPFFVLNPDTIWNKNYYEELVVLENSYLNNKKPILLLVDKVYSYDKSFKGDFNLNDTKVSRDESNEFIFTGLQILDKSIFSSKKDKVFSMNKIWNYLIKENLLMGVESKQQFYHLNTKEIYDKMLSLNITD